MRVQLHVENADTATGVSVISEVYKCLDAIGIDRARIEVDIGP